MSFLLSSLKPGWRLRPCAPGFLQLLHLEALGIDGRAWPPPVPTRLPELLALGVTAGLHVWRGNTLLSIGVGTGLYMAVLQSGVAG